MKGPQPSVNVGCGRSTGEDDCVVSFICTEALGEK